MPPDVAKGKQLREQYRGLFKIFTFNLLNTTFYDIIR